MHLTSFIHVLIIIHLFENIHTVLQLTNLIVAHFSRVIAQLSQSFFSFKNLLDFFFVNCEKLKVIKRVINLNFSSDAIHTWPWPRQINCPCKIAQENLKKNITLFD